ARILIAPSSTHSYLCRAGDAPDPCLETLAWQRPRRRNWRNHNVDASRALALTGVIARSCRYRPCGDFSQLGGLRSSGQELRSQYRFERPAVLSRLPVRLRQRVPVRMQDQRNLLSKWNAPPGFPLPELRAVRLDVFVDSQACRVVVWKPEQLLL